MDGPFSRHTNTFSKYCFLLNILAEQWCNNFFFTIIIMGRVKRKKCLRTCAKCADSDHPSHAQSLIRAFALHWNILQHPMIQLVDSKGPYQTARMRRLIWAFTVRICTETYFRMARAYNNNSLLCKCIHFLLNVTQNIVSFKQIIFNFKLYQILLSLFYYYIKHVCQPKLLYSS